MNEKRDGVMNQPTFLIRSIPVVGVLALAIGLTACGSSSTPKTTSTTAAATRGSGGARRAQIAACLKKQGITLPNRRPGTGQGGGGLFGGGGNGGPGGSGSRFRAALQKCGLRAGLGRRGFLTTAAGRSAIARFAACMARNGYALPKPNLSGSGPVYDPAKVNRNDPKFVKAAAACQSLVPRRPNGPPQGAPGATGGA
jgi:hypothetical protein